MQTQPKPWRSILKVNPNKAYFAGILHDCAKYMSDSELLNICYENNIEVSDSEKKKPDLLHAKGREVFSFAQKKYNMTDPEILSGPSVGDTDRQGRYD